MAHSAAIYKVQVHKKGTPKKPREFGDYDEATSWLGETINGIFGSGTFRNKSANDERRVACLESRLVGDQVHSMFTHGQSGQAADILDREDTLLLEQKPEHVHQIRCGSVLWLPRDKTTGWWAVHINGGRSAKGLVSAQLVRQFNEQHEDIRLKILPSVPAHALIAAVEKGQVDSVQLIRDIRPSDRAESDIDDWVPAQRKAKLELKLTGLDGNLAVARLKKYFDKKAPEDFDEIVTFDGLTFDKAKVEVELDGGRKRTFNIETPDSGHPLTEELSLPGEPSDAQAYKALAGVLKELT